jgi:hypothetical protein
MTDDDEEDDMGTRVRLLDDSMCVEARYFGVVTAEDLRSAFDDAFDLMRQHDVWLILADTSELTTDPSVFALYDVAARVADADAGLARRFREAVVAPPGAQSEESARFFEDAMVNRGLVARVFTDRDAAAAWLTEQARDLIA